MTNVTYRLVSLDPDCDIVGQTAITPELAKLVPGGLGPIRSTLLGIERTDWAMSSNKPQVVRSILIEAESTPGEWEIGVSRF